MLKLGIVAVLFPYFRSTHCAIVLSFRLVSREIRKRVSNVAIINVCSSAVGNVGGMTIYS